MSMYHILCLKLYLYFYYAANDYKNQLSSRLKSLEKEHERTLAEKTVIHKNEIEVCGLLKVYCVNILHIGFVQDLISRFKDSAQIEDDFKKTSQLLKAYIQQTYLVS